MRPAFLVMDKPPGLTSHDVVAIVRAVTGVKKVGHTGTLDPFASGVLPLALGKATRFIRFLDEELKIYDATIQLGASTTTGDPEGEILREAPIPSLEGVDEVLAGFEGDRMQTPPAYSAVKVAGRALYKYAREGKKVEVKARPIRIFSMRRLDQGEDWLRVEIQCSRGTYARVLADDIATALGSAGHLCALRRLRSGPFGLDEALDLPGLSTIVAGIPDWERVLRRTRGEERVQWRPRDEVVSELEVRARFLLEVLSHLPRTPVAQDECERVIRGDLLPPPPPGVGTGERYLAVYQDRVLAVGESDGRIGKCLLSVGEGHRGR